ncbi:MAG TPA: ORF6N domain-containing protein [Thermoanaerobaculia bacterium]|nr:ORF6N domain-containing protein [Thermoanaerobaculia bacterium]
MAVRRKEGSATALVEVHRIERAILWLRKRRVMLDTDLAALYGVPTKVLNQAVKRNRERFPPDFMFRLNRREKEKVVTDCDHLGRLRYSTSLPQAFTEHGAIMLASVLNSPKAIEVSLEVVRTFLRLREMLSSHVELARRLDELERRHDAQFTQVFATLHEMLEPAPGEVKRIGFGEG